MSCKICKSSVSDNRFLWKCESCPKRFHAACIGVKREHEDLVREYMLPACTDCQSRVGIELNLKELICQQSLLSDQIKAQTEANHRSTLKMQNDSVFHEAVDRLESQLDGIKNELKANKNATVAVTALKNHVSTLFDDTLEVVKQNITDSLKSMMANLLLEVTNLGICTQEIASKFADHSQVVEQINPINSEVLDELKALSVAFSALESNLKPTIQDPAPNIADELINLDMDMFTPQPNPSNDTNWRWINGRRTLWKVWRADWSEYDKSTKTYKGARNRRSRSNKNNDINYNSVYFNYNGAANTSNNNNNNRNYAPDRELLNAAKRQFAGPPTSNGNNRYTNFQRGETLNPLIRPTCGSSSPNWFIGHSNHIASSNVGNANFLY